MRTAWAVLALADEGPHTLVAWVVVHQVSARSSAVGDSMRRVPFVGRE